MQMALAVAANKCVGHGTQRSQKPRPFKTERVGHPEKLNQSIGGDVLKWYHHNVICRQEENLSRVGHPPYVHNNPLNLIDPDGLDCIYIDQTQGDRTLTVVRGDCISDTDSGYYVNGTVYQSSITFDDNGNRMVYSFTQPWGDDDPIQRELVGYACIGTCPDTSITVFPSKITGIPTIGLPPPPQLVNPSQATLHLFQLPLKGFERFISYLGCFGGGDAQYAKPMGSPPEPSKGSSDVPNGWMNGQRSVYTSGGPTAALNPQGSQSSEIDRVSGAAGAAANFGQCIANARNAP